MDTAIKEAVKEEWKTLLEEVLEEVKGVLLFQGMFVISTLLVSTMAYQPEMVRNNAPGEVFFFLPGMILLGTMLVTAAGAKTIREKLGWAPQYAWWSCLFPFWPFTCLFYYALYKTVKEQLQASIEKEVIPVRDEEET